MQDSGHLYIVATPIGHLDDISLRAIEILKGVDKIAAEDTRHSQRLLKSLNIEKPLVSLHEHNEKARAPALLEALKGGENIALISDAGTPLINDPGYVFVKLAHQHQIPVIPIPGACSLIAALSVSGLPTDRFVFEGFLPAKKNIRRKKIQALERESRTLIFLEAPHRIQETLVDMEELWGAHRMAVVARELTKRYERIHYGNIGFLLQEIKTGGLPEKGEMVLLIEGQTVEEEDTQQTEGIRVLNILLSELPVKQASKLASLITGVSKNALYEEALKKRHS